MRENPYAKYKQGQNNAQEVAGENPYAKYKIVSKNIQEQEVPQQSNFNQRMQERGARLANIVQGTGGYGQTLPEQVYQGTANIIGTGADVLGEGLAKTYQGAKAIMPKNWQQNIGQAEQMVGEFVAPAAEAYQRNLEAYQRSQPRTAANLEATRELANIIPFGSNAVRNIAGVATKPATKAIKNIAKDVGSINAKTTFPTYEEVKGASQVLYQKARDLGTDFSPNILNEVYQKGQDLLPKGGITNALVPLDEADKFILSMKEQLGNKMTLNDYEGLDSYFGERAHDLYLNDSPASRKYSQLQKYLRESAENPNNIIGNSEGIKAQREAVKLWGISSKMKDIQRILDTAETAEVPSTAIKTGFRRILKNDKLLRGYSEIERKAIQRAAKTGKLEGVFKTFGSRLVAIGGGLGGGTQGAIAGYGVSEAGRAASEAIKRNQGGQVLRELGKRSGLTKTQKRISPQKLKEIMKMKPRDAQKVLKELQ